MNLLALLTWIILLTSYQQMIFGFSWINLNIIESLCLKRKKEVESLIESKHYPYHYLYPLSVYEGGGRIVYEGIYGEK